MTAPAWAQWCCKACARYQPGPAPAFEVCAGCRDRDGAYARTPNGERVAVSSLQRLENVAGEYAGIAAMAALIEPTAEEREAWALLGADSLRRAAAIRGLLDVRETDDPEPYSNAEAMFADIRMGRYAVSTAASDHPIWDVSTNVAFRVVHDVRGHFFSGGDFGWSGERKACGAHAPLLPAFARQALYTECIAQTAHCIARGAFTAQACAFLPSAAEFPWEDPYA